MRFAQQQQLRLCATNLLMRGIVTNNLIGNLEAETGLLPNSNEDQELDEDDGCLLGRHGLSIIEH